MMNDKDWFVSDGVSYRMASTLYKGIGYQGRKNGDIGITYINEYSEELLEGYQSELSKRPIFSMYEIRKSSTYACILTIDIDNNYLLWALPINYEPVWVKKIVPPKGILLDIILEPADQVGIINTFEIETQKGVKKFSLKQPKTDRNEIKITFLTPQGRCLLNSIMFK